MPGRAFVFAFGEGLPSDDPVARWITSLAMAWNDIVFTHDLYTQHSDGGRGVYLVRVAAAHLSEALESNGPFGAGYDDWPDVQALVAALPKRARDDFGQIRAVRTDRATEGTFGWRLDRMRNYVFHYPHLHAGQSSGKRLEIARILHRKLSDEGSITLDDGTVKGTRLGFADEISITLALKRAEVDPSGEPELRAFTLELLRVQQRFIRFGEVALDRYLRGLPNGTLRPRRYGLRPRRLGMPRVGSP